MRHRTLGAAPVHARARTHGVPPKFEKFVSKKKTEITGRSSNFALNDDVTEKGRNDAF